MNKTTFLEFKRHSVYTITVILLSLNSYAQNTFVPKIQTLTESVCELPLGEFTGLVSIPRAPETVAKMDAGSPCATFIVNYNGFTPEAQAAFQYAVDIWAHSIESSVTINVSATFTALGPNVLGSAGPATFLTSNAPGAQPNTFYPAALWEKLEGADRSIFGGSNDISAEFSSEFNWYYGTDANPPANQVDFVSVVLHELGHGLGFIGFASLTPSTPDDIGAVREPNNAIPAIYESYIENGSGTAILSFSDPSAALGVELVSNDLYCNSPQAITQLDQGGILPRIYVPTTWSPGSSYYHWNDSTFPNSDINSLMRSSIGPGQANHNPGPITLGFFQDMGWSICPGALSIDDITISNVTVSPNPFSNEITVTLTNSYFDSFKLSLFDLNGRLIKSKTSEASNGKLTLFNLNDLDDGLYIVKITNSTSGKSITKKIVKN